MTKTIFMQNCATPTFQCQPEIFVVNYIFNYVKRLFYYHFWVEFYVYKISKG